MIVKNRERESSRTNNDRYVSGCRVSNDFATLSTLSIRRPCDWPVWVAASACPEWTLGTCRTLLGLIYWLRSESHSGRSMACKHSRRLQPSKKQITW